MSKMEAGFSFPPPPPPPPKITQDSNGTRSSQNDFHAGRGRGFGRGRNRDNSRGCIDRNQYNKEEQYLHSNSHHGSSQFGSPSTIHSNVRTEYFTGHTLGQRLPPGAYVNPNFGQAQTHLGYMPISKDGQRVHVSSHFTASPASSPPRTVAGHKRKLEAIRGPIAGKRQQTPQTAPIVPSFGAPIIPPKSNIRPNDSGEVKSRRAFNALGLTPAMETTYSPSEDEEDDNELDEEAMHQELGAKLTFEHNGVVMSLTSAADLNAWQDERRRRWPTRARMAEREEQRRRVGEERRRLLTSAFTLDQPAVGLAHAQSTNDKHDTTKHVDDVAKDEVSDLGVSDLATSAIPKPRRETGLERAKRELAEQTARIDAMRRRVADGEAALEQAKVAKMERERGSADAVVDSIAYDEDDASGSCSVLSESSMLSSESESQPSSDEDAPPEEATSKATQVEAASGQKALCKYFLASGRCRDGDACRFSHEVHVRKSGFSRQAPTPVLQHLRQHVPHTRPAARKSIYGRLMEQQQDEEDRLALKVIKHLGTVGFFSQKVEEKSNT